MSDQMICKDSSNATSSLESPFGLTLSERLAGQTRDLFGLEVVLANLSARQAKALRLLTSGTSGQPSTISSKSADLSAFLVSRLRVKTQTLGSTLYKMTWKPWVTPSGRSRFRLRASGRRTSATDSTGQEALVLSARPTATTRDWKDGVECENVPLNCLLGRVVWMAGWHTPVVRDHRNSAGDGSNPRDLPRQTALAGWPTTGAYDGSRGGPQDPMKRKAGGHSVSLQDSPSLAGWGTSACPSKTADGHQAGNNRFVTNTVQLVKATEPARLTASGVMLTGLDAGMDSGGPLNPNMSRWLMGLPPAWDDCAPLPLKKSKVK